MHRQTPGQQGQVADDDAGVQQTSGDDRQAAQSVAARPLQQSSLAGRGAGRVDDWQSQIANRAAG